MQDQGKHHSSGVKSFVKEHKKLKATGSAVLQEQGKGTAVPVKHAEAVRGIFSSDAERKLDGARYRLGDMVWAKVKSHPWWPGQLYDPALASANAMEFKRDSCFLVAFFGDSTFGWFAETELIPYEPNFAQKSKQTSAYNFVDAVEDSLDEVRRRVKWGLTCHCSSLGEASEMVGKRAGLLYDRQLHGIRRTFEPAKMLSSIKQLACSPFSFSQNMLRSTITGAQTDASRLLISCKKLSEGKKTEVITEISQSNCIKADVFGSAKVFKYKTSPVKNVAKKGLLNMSLSSRSCQEQDDRIRKHVVKELEGTDELGKVKQHTKGVISKKRKTEKSKDFVGDSVQDNQAMSVSVGKETLPSKAPSKERGIQENGQSPEQSQSHASNILSNTSIPGLVDGDSLATNYNGHAKNVKKCAGLAVEILSNVVHKAEVMELGVAGKEPNALFRKAKVAEVEGSKVLKLKTAKKFAGADVELSQARKKVKVVSRGKDKQHRRFLEDESTDTLLQEIKERKLLPESTGKYHPDYTSVAFDPLPTSDFLLRADKVISGSTGPDNDLKHLQVESLPRETEGILPVETPEMTVLEVGQLHWEDTPRHKHVDDDATEAQDVGAGFVIKLNEPDKYVDDDDATEAQDVGAGFAMRPNKSDAEQMLEDKSQAEITSSIIKKKEEKEKDINLFEHREVPTFQAETTLNMSTNKGISSPNTNTIGLHKPGAFSNHDHHLKGQREGENPESLSAVIEDRLMTNKNALPSEADPIMSRYHGTSGGQAFACGEVQSMNAAVQTKKEVSKQSQPSNKVFSSKKRALEECLTANKKRIKTLSTEREGECHADFGGEDSEEHDASNRWDEEDTLLQNFHDRLMSVAAKPLDAVKEFPSALCRAFTNFRKVNYKKAVYHTGSENSISPSPSVVSEGVIGLVNEHDKISELVLEQAEGKVISIEAEPSKIEEARIQEGVDSLVSHKQSEEDNTVSQLRPARRSATIVKSPSSSSISLRPAFEANIPMRGSKDILNRFGQRVPCLLDAAEKIISVSKVKSYSEERALVISFPRGFLLPSKKELREVFAKFGDLKAPLTRIDPKSGSAHIVFRRTQDAEAALISMKENPVFENARFWLKPKEADGKGITKLGSRSTTFSDRPILSSGQLLEAKLVPHKLRNKAASDRGLLVSPRNVCDTKVVNRIGASENVPSIMAEIGGREGASHDICGAKNLQTSSMNACASQKAPAQVSGPGQGNLDGIYSGVAAPSSIFFKSRPRSLPSPIVSDISEPFLALLHQLHDLVVSTGFVM